MTTTAESVVMTHLRALSARQQAARAAVASAPISNSSLIEPASDKQKKFIDGLLIERQYTALTVEQIDNIKKDKAQSSRFIKFLLTLAKAVETPVEPAPAPKRLDFSAIPDGNYAVRTDDVVKFYRVSTKGNFKNVQVRASDALHKVFGKAGIAILHQIVNVGLEESRMLFASELGRCWMCGKTLTDETSRELGIGPKCRSGE